MIQCASTRERAHDFRLHVQSMHTYRLEQNEEKRKEIRNLILLDHLKKKKIKPNHSILCVCVCKTYAHVPLNE